MHAFVTKPRSSRTGFSLPAHAMPGQLERCLAAGMNAYLTKPLEIGRLRETLDRFGLARQGSAPSPTQGTGVVPGEPVEVARLLDLTAGDKAFALQIVDTFAQSGDRARNEMRSALSSGDRNRLQRAAHQLKGASANIHAARLRDLATAIENRSSNAAEADLMELIGKLGKELDRVSAFLRRELG